MDGARVDIAFEMINELRSAIADLARIVEICVTVPQLPPDVALELTQRSHGLKTSLQHLQEI
jgi:hypothetical protein